jgi:hypothetical protein
MNLLSNTFVKADWQTVIDADATYNAYMVAMASYKAQLGTTGCDDYVNVDSIMDVAWKEPGPEVPLLDLNADPVDFPVRKSIYDYRKSVRKEIILWNKDAHAAKTAQEQEHAKNVAMIDLAFSQISYMGQYKQTLMDEIAARWAVFSLGWRPMIHAMGLPPVPAYLVETWDCMGWIKLQLANGALQQGGIDLLEAYEDMEKENSSVHIYRELWSRVLTFATGQPAMHHIYVEQWNKHFYVDMTLQQWITDEKRQIGLIGKSGDGPVSAQAIDQHIIQCVKNEWALAQFQHLIEDGIAHPGARTLTWNGESNRILRLVLQMPLINNQMIKKQPPAAVGARGLRTNDPETHKKQGEKRKTPPTATQGGGEKSDNCKRCWSYRHHIKECNGTRCWKCQMVFPVQAEGEKRFYHDTDLCISVPRQRTANAGGRTGGRTSNSGGGRGRGGRGDQRTGGAGAAAGAVTDP